MLGMCLCVLFYILSMTTDNLFKELDDQLECLLSTYDNIQADEHQLSTEIEKWMRRYESVRRYVDQINGIFGFILFMNLIGIFVQSASNFFDSLLLYTFIVLVSLKFDLCGMMKDTLLLRKGLDPSVSDTYDLNFPYDYTYFETLRDVYSFYRIAHPGLVMCLFKSFCIWLRLLIILVPSHRMHSTVIHPSIACTKQHNINTCVTFRGKGY